MTRKWLTNDDDFDKLYKRVELLNQHCAVMRPPHVQVRRPSGGMPAVTNTSHITSLTEKTPTS